MKILILLLIFTTATNYAQYFQTGASWNMVVKDNFTINQPSFTNSEGLNSRIEGVEHISELKGWDIKILGLFNYKRFFYKFDFNIFQGFEEYEVTHITEKIRESWPQDVKYIDTVTLELNNEYVSVGNELMFKLSKQPNSLYLSFQHIIKFNNYHAGSVAEDTEIEKWLTNVKRDVRFNFGAGYIRTNVMIFAKYTPSFRLQKLSRGLTFSYVEIGFAFMGRPQPFFKKKSIYKPKL